ncbi:TolB family protein [Paenibacillus ehimensis]|uniref:TolB family protein n=1 Tax=Paenibacillus ehimensis TaxID=79264 RepID=UPI000FD8BA6A|nr:PD40 domain-containing protein [Paenibacillus ehimensis]
MGSKQTVNRFHIIAFILILIVGLSWIVHLLIASNQSQDGGQNYKGWLAGITADGTGSQLVAYHPEPAESKTILKLPNVTPDNFGAISSDGTKAAYTQWNEQQTVRYLVVQSLASSEQNVFFDNLPAMNEIKTISWFPDSRRILFVKSDQSAHVDQEIGVLDTSSGNIQTLVKGGIWLVKQAEEENGEERMKYYMTQDELDQLVTTYGGKPVPLDDAGGYLMVEFAAPVLSPDGNRIVYSATLNRNYAKGENVPLWLASSLWVYDLTSGKNKMIYSPSDRSAIGKAIWTSDGSHIAFISYTGANGEGGAIEYMDLASEKVKTIFPPTAEHHNNVNLIALDRNEISFISAPKSGTFKDAKRWILNPETGEKRLMPVQLKGQNALLRNFSNVQ